MNGEAVPVSRANLAFKAIPLGPGANRIQFRFDNGRASLAQSFLAAASFPILIALALAQIVSARALRKNSPEAVREDDGV